jgi:ribose transport system permease protein
MSDAALPARTKRDRPDITNLVLQGLERGGLPLLLVAVFVFFAVNSETGSVFTSTANLDNILGNQAVTGLVALAMVIPLVAGYFDLSVSATCGIANIAVAATIGTRGWPVWAGILFALVIGAFIGFLIGFLVAKVKLNAFVVTLGAYTLLGGLAQLYTKGEVIINGIPNSFTSWGTKDWLGVPRPFILLLVIAFVFWYLLAYVPFGRYLESIGSNETAARLVGIKADRTIWISFILSGMIAAAAGALETSRAGNGSAEATSAFLFPAFAAVFLGATTIRPGRYNVWGTLIGVYFVAISVSGFTLLGASTWVQPVFNGSSLLVAVALSTLIARSREHRMAVSAASGGAGRRGEPHSPLLAGGGGAGPATAEEGGTKITRAEE